MGVKDIDFDELDRAVSSLLGSVDDDKKVEQDIAPATENKVKEPSFEPRSIETSSPAVLQATSSVEKDSPVIPMVAHTSAPSESLTRSDRPVAMKRKGGRFMDVMHPSSDMKSTPSLTPPSARAGRFTTVNPSRTMASADPVKDDSAIDMAQLLADNQPQNEPASQPDTEQPSVSLDPLDFHGFTLDDSKTDTIEDLSSEESSSYIESPVTEQKTAELSSASDDVATIPPASPTSYSEPLSSPFLTDTKVDKRPLGAFSVSDEITVNSAADEVAAGTPDQSVDAELVEMQRMAGEASAQTLLATEVEDTQTIADAAVLPEELETELLSIESSESVAANASPPRQEAQTENVREPHSQATARLQGGSIMQQYKEQQPLDTQQQTTAIYDVDTYERPLKHPKKKNSGWLVVTGIILLILAGVAGGAYVYLYVL